MEEDTLFSASGHFELVWAPQDDMGIFELEVSRQPDFSERNRIYNGPLGKLFISGKPDGLYYYRVRHLEEDDRYSAWSDPIVVQVEHQSLRLAWTLFALGSIVFAAIVAVVVVGARDKNITILNG